MSTLVVGVGNPVRGDDGVGAAVLRQVRAATHGSVEMLEQTEPVDLIAHLLSHESVVVVDATRPGTHPGSVQVLQVDRATALSPLAAGGSASTHGIGVTDAVELARTLGHLPERLVLVGVEAQDIGLGQALSSPVRDAVPRAAEIVVAVLAALTGQPESG